MKDNVARTLSIVREMAMGKQLTLPTGDKVGMGENMMIGAVYVDSNGNEGISPLSSMDLQQLDYILTKYDIGHAIPLGG